MKTAQEGDSFRKSAMRDKIFYMWEDLAQRVEKNPIWILFQFCRGINDDPFPQVPFFGPVPQHALQDEDIAKVDTFKEYNVQMFLDNFDFHMLGYFLKLLWLHYQPEIPSWVLDMHLMYVRDKEPGNVKTKEKRARMYSPEGLCMQLENVSLPFGDYAPSAFGKIIEDQFNECFGKDILKGKATLAFKCAENA